MGEFDLDPQTKKDLQMFGKSGELVETNEFSSEINTKDVETRSLISMVVNYLLPVFMSSGFLWALNNFAKNLSSKVYFSFLGIIILGIIVSIGHILAFFTKKSFWLFFLVVGLPGIGFAIYSIFFAK
ncbi:TPA: hypothetical protein DDW69_02370 [candidate division CPR2 bacterium]|uniref:Uncharacterized protein n=1 Tax=candidate division CPR2 bacterium GW2011_GWC1_41_48 TaxID=1618344 RepID=A0A0G0YJZ4_UNCC2|nr:MAG: hypothetical protein UT47_C0001G0276 [candidate division CPR2 bacterium GW2011_GWC2_39_35]KKR28870.1 MAG: hypothetical protein UT59_C0017G0004 [candidate division CPR2 bacterium GW2011_GWD1_39_7]KKR29157.1 MAG: hypothetical protein UT60_C0006G0020 [candidate division CPR2 bacterium GW2011_GWD2_39_7]KKS09871.1 MAG: hypothetical protein UU65_C0001G0276 [candidate division CPR2 bacterium GW2011_GWC1_41_48]OGB61498.1 MAG: hypothetical protein A2Y27_02490 [candidate division CPR2 bacterium G